MGNKILNCIKSQEGVFSQRNPFLHGFHLNCIKSQEGVFSQLIMRYRLRREHCIKSQEGVFSQHTALRVRLNQIVSNPKRESFHN